MQADEHVGDCGEKRGTPMVLQKEDVWSFGTRDAVLQILGNLVYLNREAQDQVGNENENELNQLLISVVDDNVL